MYNPITQEDMDKHGLALIEHTNPNARTFEKMMVIFTRTFISWESAAHLEHRIKEGRRNEQDTNEQGDN